MKEYNRAIVYTVKGGDQPDVSYRGVESKDLVLSPDDKQVKVIHAERYDDKKNPRVDLLIEVV